MNGRKGLIALAVLCALAFSAIAASGAVAKGITAFACEEVAPNTGEFTNADCSSKTEEEGGKLKPKNWVHAEFTPNLPIQLTMTALGRTEFDTTIAGAEVVLQATGAECIKCMVENHKEKIGEQEVMVFSGSGGHLDYTGVTINLPTCKVTGGEINTEPLKMKGVMSSESGPFAIEMSPAEAGGTTVAVIHLEKSGAGECPIGSSITVKGHVNPTATGAIGKFNSGAGELTAGKQELRLTGEVTLRGGITPTPEEPNPLHRPLGLTTTAT